MNANGNITICGCGDTPVHLTKTNDGKVLVAARDIIRAIGYWLCEPGRA